MCVQGLLSNIVDFIQYFPNNHHEFMAFILHHIYVSWPNDTIWLQKIENFAFPMSMNHISFQELYEYWQFRSYFNMLSDIHRAPTDKQNHWYMSCPRCQAMHHFEHFEANWPCWNRAVRTSNLFIPCGRYISVKEKNRIWCIFQHHK